MIEVPETPLEISRTGTSLDDWKNLLCDLLPSQGHWTEEDYLWLTDCTSRLVEYTDGYLEVLPMPTDLHQALLRFLFLAFDAFVFPRGGTVRFSGLRLQIRPGKIREPDLLLVLSAKDPRRQNRFWTGADLALEVVSEDKPERDLVDKRNDYAEGKIPEYWIVNPLNETITVLTLKKRAYKKVGQFGRGSTAHSVLLPGFAVAVDQVMNAP